MHLSVANNRKYDPIIMRIILSHNAGMGKSLQGEQVSERLRFKLEKSQLHNKNVDITSLIERWKGNKIKDGKVVYGIDVTQAVEISERDDLIFSLAILTGVQDFKGGVWNVNDNNVYSFEVTIENDAGNAFISTIPKTLCLSPSECRDFLRDHNKEGNAIVKQDENSPDSDFYALLDHKFKEDNIQRPVNYLVKWFKNEKLVHSSWLIKSPPEQGEA